jgi:hypothetical protein
MGCKKGVSVAAVCVLSALIWLLASPVAHSTNPPDRPTTLSGNLLSDTDMDSNFVISIQPEYTHALPGRNVTLTVSIANPVAIGSLNLLLSFQQEAIHFFGARPVGILEDWEYFTYRLFEIDDCGGWCPTGFIRFIAVADIPDGEDPGDVYQPAGDIIELQFNVTLDRRYCGLCPRVGFVWHDCGDNLLTNASGDTTYTDLRIYDGTDDPIWDEDDDVGFPEVNRPPDLGTPDSCLNTLGYGKWVRNVVFANAFICNICMGVDIGDINLNGIESEVGDAVLFANYFIYGDAVWDPIWYENQILGTDLNDDGQLLTVADLVVLIRIISGDSSPWSKPDVGSTASGAVDISYRLGGDMVVTANSPVDVGAAAFIFRHTRDAVGTPILSDETKHMTLGWSDQDGELRILVYSMEAFSIDAGAYELFSVPVSGDGDIELVEVQLSDAYGSVLAANVSRLAPPAVFELAQNYPNPFNASTTISFALPQASDWDLRIYNIVGQLVDQFTGRSSAGQVTIRWDAPDAPSGIYFYRLTAGDFTDSRKMILMK